MIETIFGYTILVLFIAMHVGMLIVMHMLTFNK